MLIDFLFPSFNVDFFVSCLSFLSFLFLLICILFLLTFSCFPPGTVPRLLRCVFQLSVRFAKGIDVPDTPTCVPMSRTQDANSTSPSATSSSRRPLLPYHTPNPTPATATHPLTPLFPHPPPFLPFVVSLGVRKRGFISPYQAFQKSIESSTSFVVFFIITTKQLETRRCALFCKRISTFSLLGKLSGVDPFPLLTDVSAHFGESFPLRIDVSAVVCIFLSHTSSMLSNQAGGPVECIFLFHTSSMLPNQAGHGARGKLSDWRHGKLGLRHVCQAAAACGT